MQFMDQIGEEKEAGKNGRAEVKQRQARILGSPRRPLGQPGQPERDTADPSRQNKGYSRDVTMNDSDNLRFVEHTVNAEQDQAQEVTSVNPVGTRSSRDNRKPHIPNYRRKYQPFQGLDYSRVLTQQELLTASFHSISCSMAGRSTNDILDDIDKTYRRMKFHRDGLNDPGEDHNHHSGMVQNCEQAMTALQKEMAHLASSQDRLTTISESLTQMTNDARMDEDWDEEDQE
jgi:hypothetical protein